MIVREKKRFEDSKELAQEVGAFYDSLTPEERSDERAWGEFAEAESGLGGG